MSNFKFEWDYKGFGKILKSDGMATAVDAEAKKIKHRCGSAYFTHTYRNNKFVPVGIVAANTAEAIEDNLENNTLQKALR